MKKVADASGSKYSAGSGGGAPQQTRPPVASKPVFTPSSSGARNVNPLIAARNRKEEAVDEDGWGANAPQVSRTKLEKVDSAYKPTKVNLADLSKSAQEPSRFTPKREPDEDKDVVKGAYQPVGKVDIAALRAAARESKDDRPTPVKGSYEPVGKVDIAAIRAKAQPPRSESSGFQSPAARETPSREPERITSLPKPKVSNKFGSSAFGGTKPPTPGGGGLGFVKYPAPAPVVGTASRTFADSGGKTPAQLWAEKKAREGGGAGAAPAAPAMADQKSGSEWKSGYSGKSWAPVQTASVGRGMKEQSTGGTADDQTQEDEAPGGGVSAIRDRFKSAPPVSADTRPPPAMSQPSHDEETRDRSTGPSGGFALPGLPTRSAPEEEPTEQESRQMQQEMEREPEPEPEPEQYEVPTTAARDVAFERPEERDVPPPIPAAAVEQNIPREEDIEEDDEDAARGAAAAYAQQNAPEPPAQGNGDDGKRAIVQFDYEMAEDNEVELNEGEWVTDIDMVDPDWWVGTNSKGARGLFPSNYVELVEDDGQAEEPPAAEERPAPPPPAPATAGSGSDGTVATALYDYEAAEDNGKCCRMKKPRLAS